MRYIVGANIVGMHAPSDFVPVNDPARSEWAFSPSAMVFRKTGNSQGENWERFYQAIASCSRATPGHVV